MSTPTMVPAILSKSGSWQIMVYPGNRANSGNAIPILDHPGAPGGRQANALRAAPPGAVSGGYTGGAFNVTVVRGAPTQLGSMTTTDPFGPGTASLTFPSITLLDTPGAGDLTWLQEESDVDIEWHAVDSEGVITVPYVWEGYFASFDWGEDESSTSLSVTCAGAMRQMDNYLAKPEYLFQPLPYEVAILRQFAHHPDCRLATPDPAKDSFPAGWNRQFSRLAYAKDQPWTLPAGVAQGDNWSGMLTRETGHFEPTLTSYIQGLLANMYTETGQFTLMLGRGRKPVLSHREHRYHATVGETMVVDLLWQGVQLHPSKDYTQKVGVVYGQGRSLNGDTFSGMEVTADGQSTYYDPLAFDPVVHPITNNKTLNKNVMRKEINLSFPDGLTDLEARQLAERHRKQFSDPGITGQLILKVDPLLYAGESVAPTEMVARQTISAGQQILVRGLFGNQSPGVLFHITETSTDFEATVTLTVDTQFRDYLTVAQVRARTRDALVPYRMLSTAGTFDPKIPDLLFPWSYTRGAGVMPIYGSPIFNSLGPAAIRAKGTSQDPEAIPFPWTDYTTAFPPSRYPQYYIRCRPASKNANNNWANRFWKQGLNSTGNPAHFNAYPIMLAAAGSIRMIQLAAYDAHGNVKAVPFHASLYVEGQPSYQSMPMIPAATMTTMTKAATMNIVKGSKNVIISHLPTGHGLHVGDRIDVTGGIRGVNGIRTVTSIAANQIAFLLTIAVSYTGKHRCTVKRVARQPYPAGQHYPFFPGAFEKLRPDGTTASNSQQVTVAATMLAGWGNYYEKAGYWPGSSSAGEGNVTGLLVDETPIPFDFRGKPNGIGVYDTPATNLKTPSKVTGWVMIYCDADAAADTFFLGRLFRQDYLNA